MLALLWYLFIILQVADSTKALYDKDLHADQHGNHTFIQPREDTITVNLDARGLTSTIIRTPRFPKPYPPRSLIKWSVQGTCEMEVSCLPFNLRPRNKKLICRDYLEINDGISTNWYCGNELNGFGSRYLSHTDQLHLTFKSSQKGNGKYEGFNCTISCSTQTTFTTTDITTTDITTTGNTPCYCGIYTPPVDDNHKIVGGQDAEENQFPWQAVIVWYGTPTNDKNGLLCGGSLINDQWVLTAAHCTDHLGEPKQNQIQIFLCAYCWTNQPAGLRVFDVVEVIQHPHYNSSNLDNDISLLKLNTKIDFSDSECIRPVCLPIDSNDPIPDEDDVSAAISGFGSLAFKGPLPDCLQYAIVETMTNPICQTFYPPGWITPNMICAAFDNRDACQGDSGGPMQTNATSIFFGTYYVQIGIVSWGIDCAQPEYPGVYARVSEYISWIHDHAEWSTALTCPPPL